MFSMLAVRVETHLDAMMLSISEWQHAQMLAKNMLASAQAVVGQQEALYELLQIQVQGRPCHARLACAILALLSDGSAATPCLHCLREVLCGSLELKYGAISDIFQSWKRAQFRCCSTID